MNLKKKIILFVAYGIIGTVAIFLADTENKIIPKIGQEELTNLEIAKVDAYIKTISEEKKKVIFLYRRELIKKACQDLKNNNQLTDANIKATVTKFVNELN